MYTCWQCGAEFEREADEWFCTACCDNREPLEFAAPQFKGDGFYATEGK
jgi:predicted nucleic acid-binding Zn ribbon protein